MDLRECTCQLPETLEEHFSELNRRYVNGRGTLALIEALRAYPDARVVYGLSNVDRLCLLSQDDYTTPWWVVITSHSLDEFLVEFRLPAQLAPWRGAQVTGKTRHVEQAVEMVVKGMDLSRGWNREIGDVPIGLDEIIEQSLSLFRFRDAEAECRSRLSDWENQTRLCPVSGREVLVTLIAQTGPEEALAYRHDASHTVERWGLLATGESTLTPDDEWHYWMDDAYCRSQAWDGPPPPDLG